MDTNFLSIPKWRTPWLARPNWYSNYFEAVLGTTLELKIRAQSPAQAKAAEAALLAEIDRLELIFSRFLPESELNRFLRSKQSLVSTELLEVLKLADLWRERTHGAFHPGADAIQSIWQACAKEDRIPNANELEPVLEQLRQPLWVISGHVQRLTDLPINFNALAKGWIAHQACQAACLEGVQDVLVNIGGDLCHVGMQPQCVTIADPGSDVDNAPQLCKVQIQNQAVATSGHTRRGLRIGSKWFSHVFDPRNGQPVGHTLSATVIAPDAASADALATAFCVLEPVQSLELANGLPEIACLVVSKDGQHHTNQRWNQSQSPHSPRSQK